ncbi:uncharacterized protein [Paramormyrops kingsleyae]|uniref:uncharacterized protein n=1 Tax=Paramormyrops kingsleyae TaxID=1676925 RepID=UPI003B971833
MFLRFHEFVEDKFISILVVNFERSPLTMENLLSLALSVPSFYWRLTGEELDPSLLHVATARLQVVHHGTETGVQHGDGESPAEEDDHYRQELPSPSSRREASPAAPASTTEDANGLPEALPLAWGEDEPSSPSLSVASDTQPGSQIEPEHAEPSSSTFWIPVGPNSTWQQLEIEGRNYLRKLDELSIPEGLWGITDYGDDHTVVMSVHVSVHELPSPSSRREASPAAPASTTEDANGLPEALPLAWGEDEPSSPSLSVASDTQPGSQIEPEHAEPSSSTSWIPVGPNSTWQQLEIEGRNYLRKLDELSIPEGLWGITDYGDDHTVLMSVHVSVHVSSSLRTWGVRQEERPPQRPAGTSQRKRKAEPDDTSGSSSPPPHKRPMRF